MPENGPSRREFDQLARRFDYMDEHGSRRVGTVEARVTDLRDDVRALDSKVARNTQALWGLATVLLIAAIGIIATLLTQAPS